MKNEEIPYPRERDKVVMGIIIAAGMAKAEVRSLNRCRGFLGVIFLSDMSTADGKYLEKFVRDPQKNITKSEYKFPREEPTKTDWTWWTKFWLNYTATGNGYRQIWVNGYIQLTEHGGGITTKKQMTYKG